MTKIENNPITLFDIWFKEAKKTTIKEPEALNLATATKDGKPSNRMVLLKEYDEKGFTFYTNLNSKKGQDIKENPYASMCFFWPETDKQIRIDGKLQQVSDEQADQYFKSRPLNSQIGATISKQSQPIKENNFSLFTKITLEAFKNLATARNPQRPKYWSGFTLIPNKLEFWQRGEFRIHKRICYTKTKTDEWETTFLYP